MLKELGFTKFAYDWRAEHLPTFEEELGVLKRHKIELTAVWFPPELNADARQILETLKRNNVRTQLWVTMDDPAPPNGLPDQGEDAGKETATKIAAAVKALRPIVVAAAEQGCEVGLYNHGGWFGEPENQLAIVKALDAPNVGIVYNLHHGHDHVGRFAEVLAKLKPHLLAINLNGMDRNGERLGARFCRWGKASLTWSYFERSPTAGTVARSESLATRRMTPKRGFRTTSTAWRGWWSSLTAAIPALGRRRGRLCRSAVKPQATSRRRA